MEVHQVRNYGTHLTTTPKFKTHSQQTQMSYYRANKNSYPFWCAFRARTRRRDSETRIESDGQTQLPSPNSGRYRTLPPRDF